VSTCGSCGAQITWAVTTNGKRMPVDTEPDPNGNVVMHAPAPGQLPIAAVVPRRLGDPEPVFARHTSHFATCPHADQHRRTH
jgi:hypothetical protein